MRLHCTNASRRSLPARRYRYAAAACSPGASASPDVGAVSALISRAMACFGSSRASRARRSAPGERRRLNRSRQDASYGRVRSASTDDRLTLASGSDCERADVVVRHDRRSSWVATRSAAAVATARAGKAGAAVVVSARWRWLVGDGRMRVPAQKQESCCYAIDGRRLRRGAGRGCLAALREPAPKRSSSSVAMVSRTSTTTAASTRLMPLGPATWGRRRSRPGRRRPSAVARIR